MSLKKADVILMAACTGLIVANIYYCQPLIVLIAKSFGKPQSTAGCITYLTQAGYAAGLLFIVPLGDKTERKRQIVIMMFAAIAALIAAATSQGIGVLAVSSFFIGFCSVVPQLILPLAASLSEPAERGRVIGTVMSGLLVGILVSRTVSGFIAHLWGWRSIFWIAAGVCALLTLLIQIRFPLSKPSYKGSYGSLMKSLWELIKTQPVLREAAIINALSFAMFGCFWTSMVLFLSNPPYHFDSGAIGLFGLAGIAGASAAPIVGRLSDKQSPRIAIGTGLACMVLSIGLLYTGIYSLIPFIAGIIVLDFALQCIHVSNQSRVYALIPEARNRLNTVYMSCTFVGASCGSAAGLALWDMNKWAGVCMGMLGMMAIACFIFMATYKKMHGLKLRKHR